MKIIMLKFEDNSFKNNKVRVSFKDFGNMNNTHGIGNFSIDLLKIGGKMHDLHFAVIK
jgi:hypothetical protein